VLKLAMASGKHIAFFFFYFKPWLILNDKINLINVSGFAHPIIVYIYIYIYIYI
jgi:hypothetical protein